MMNELNDIGHYGVFRKLPEDHGFVIEQNHFCRSNSLSVEELWHLISKMYERMTQFYLTAELVIEKGVDPIEAVLKIEKLRGIRQLAKFLGVAVGVACNFTEPYVPVIKLRLIW